MKSSRALAAALMLIAHAVAAPAHQQQVAFGLGRTAHKRRIRAEAARCNTAGSKLARKAFEGKLGLGHPR